MERRPAKVVLLALSLVICAGPSRAAAADGQARSEAGAVAPRQAVSILVTPYIHGARTTWRCNVMTHTLRACPVTARLRYRLLHPDRPAPGCMGSCTLDPICRCQNQVPSLRIRVIDNNGQVVHVNTRWDFYQSSFTITATVLRRPGGWLVDNLYCAGRPGTTIYRRIVPCG